MNKGKNKRTNVLNVICNPIIIAILVIVTTAVFFLCTFNSESSVIVGEPEINTESPMAAYAGCTDDVIYYNASDDGQGIDFSSIDNKAMYISLGQMKFGAYKLRIEYNSEYDTSASNNPVVQLQVISESTSSCKSDIVRLFDFKSWQESLVWITSLNGIDDGKIELMITGFGDAEIDSIKLCEYQPWKIGFILAELIIFLLILIVYKVMRAASTKKKLQFLGIVCLIVFSSYPALYDFTGSFVGHDFNFHIGRIASIANEMSYGHFPALYQSDVFNGYGYNSLCMYGNIFLYIPAVMHLLGYPLTFCYNAYVVIINIVTCLICLYSFKKIFGSDGYSICATVLYMLAAPRLCNIYIRAAVGEYTAATFLPLVLYGFYHIYTSDKRATFREMLPIIIGVSGIIESHVLTLEILAGFTILFVLRYLKTTIRNIIPLIETFVAIIALNLFFIVPFLQGYSQGLQVSEMQVGREITSSGSYLFQLFSMFMTSSGANVYDGSYQELPLTIGFSLTLGLGLFMLVQICKKDFEIKDKTIVRHMLRTCFIYAVLSIWLASAYFPWSLIANADNKFSKILMSIQFPWRFLQFAVAFLVFLTVYALKKINENKNYFNRKLFYCNRTTPEVIIILVTLVVAGAFFSGYTNTTNRATILSNTGSINADSLYLPQDMENNTYDTSIHYTQDGGASVKRKCVTEYGGKIFHVTKTTEDCQVTFPITYYDYMVVSDMDTGEYFKTTKGYNQQLAIELQKGYEGDVLITYQVPLLWKCIYVFSLVCILILILFTCRWRLLQNWQKNVI